MLYTRKKKVYHEEWLFRLKMHEDSKTNSSIPRFPVVWTMSPKLLVDAPEWITWYYDMARQTGQDFFILPPSGDLYAYPGQMSGDVQKNFVNSTERDALMLGTTSTVSWEWVLSWPHAISTYFPQYSERNIVRGFFGVNVPYPIPIEAFSGNYKVIGSNILFKALLTWYYPSGLIKPHTWDKKDDITEKDLGIRLNELKNGTITYIYLTHDGGARLQNYYGLYQLLDSHVRIVNHEQLVGLALQKEAMKRKRFPKQ